MRFARIEMLFFVWMIPLMLLAVVYGHRKRRRILASYAAGKGRRIIGGEAGETRRAIKAGLILVSVFFLIVSLSGPQYGFRWEEVKQRGVEIVVVLDCSKSMLAQDVRPSRLERAKREIMDLLAMLQGDRVGLAAFAGTAFLQCPLTLDYSAFYIFLNALTPDFLPRGGSDVSAALLAALDGFDAESPADKAVILITDGENTGEDPAEAVSRAVGEKVKVFTVGVGTSDGVPIPDGTGGYQKDADGRIVMSRMDEGLLKKIARDTGGLYVPSVTGDMDLKTIYQNEIREKMDTATLEAGKKKVWQDRFQWFLILAIAALVAEMVIPAVRRLRVLPLTVAFVLLVVPPAAGQTAYGLVQKGVAAYEQGKYEEALKHFLDAQVSAPDEPKIAYNLGNVYYRLGRYDAAVKNFLSASETDDPALKEKAHYNAGNAHFRQRHFDRAVSAYRAALDIDPDDREARENLQFAEEMIRRARRQQRGPQQPDQQKDPAKEASPDRSGEDRDQGGDRGGSEAGSREKTSSENSTKRNPEEMDDRRPSNGDQATQKGMPDSTGQPAAGKQDAAGQGGHATPESGPAGEAQARRMLNRLKDAPGRAMMPSYSGEAVEKDW